MEKQDNEDIIKKEDKKVIRNDNFDDVFVQIKSFGFYQHLVYWFLSILKIPMAAQFVFLVFSFGTQKFECISTNMTCPINKCCNNCTSYAFDKRYVSAVSEWGLICDRAQLTAMIQSSFFWGMLFGSITGGWVSDRYGRKKCIFGNLFLMSTFSLGCAFVNSPIVLSVLRFCVGFAQISVMVSKYACSIEIVGPKERTFAGIATTLLWKIGGALNVTFSYLFPYWRHTIIASTLPGFLMLPFYLIFPESPRWLVAHGRLDEAQAILEKFGGKQNKPIDKQQLRYTLEKVRNAQLANQNVRQTHNVTDLCKTTRLRRFSLVVCYNWFVVALLFFAMFLFVARLYGDIFMNFIIMSLADIPAIILMWTLAARYGRRILFTSFMFLAAVSLLILPFIPKDVQQVRTALALIGKAVMGCEFTLIYMWTSELFPTVVRNLSIGSGSMTARFGAILAPYFVMMAQLPGVSLTIPFCIFGVLGISAALLALLLPETLFSKMEQTIEAVEEAKLDYSVRCYRNKARKEEIKLCEEVNQDGE